MAVLSLAVLFDGLPMNVKLSQRKTEQLATEDHFVVVANSAWPAVIAR